MATALSAKDGLALLGYTNDKFMQKEGSVVNYPDTSVNGPYTTLGPVLLPQIYGKDLNSIEIGSSGTIALSIYDTNVLNIDSNLSNFKTGETFNAITVNAKDDNDAIQLNSGSTAKKVVLDSLIVSENTTQNIISTTKNSLLLDDDVAISQSLSVHGVTTLNSNLSVGDDTTMAATLSVGGEATFSNNVFVEGKTLKIPTGMMAERPLPGSDYGSIFYNEEHNRFEGLHKDNYWRPFGGVIDTDMDTLIMAELTPDGDEDQLHFFANDSNVARMIMTDSNLSIALDVEINNKLSVGEEVTFGQTLYVGGSTELNDAVAIGDTLSVNDQVSFKNNLTVDGITILKNTLSVENETELKGNAYLGNALSVQGAVNIENTLSVSGPVGLLNTLSVTEKADFANTVQIAGDLSVTQNVFVDGSTNLGDTLSVTDTVTFSSNLSVGDHVVLNNTLSVKDQVTFADTLTVDGSTHLKNALSVDGNVVLKNTLYVHKQTDINDNLNVTDNLTMGGTSTIFTNKLQTVGGTKNMSLNLGSTVDDYGTLTINGNVDITGTFNRLDVNVTNLQVEDKTISLSTSSNVDAGDVHVDGPLNHQSGIRVEGIPDATITDETDPNYINPSVYTSHAQLGNVWEKSFLWNFSENPTDTTGGGLLKGPMATIENKSVTNIDSIEKESFWELKGGALRISSVVDDGTGQLEKISYSMRITKNKELQFVKHEYQWNGDGNYAPKTPLQVATFGVSFNQ